MESIPASLLHNVAVPKTVKRPGKQMTEMRILYLERRWDLCPVELRIRRVYSFSF
jgi:hypothetical protein